jgi:WD40 repeat protein
MPDDSPRLFLSYGVHDASELAERLRRDLMARGYQVWWDVNRIRAGLPWDEEVQTGLRNSQVLLALLSPQSVRRARDAGNPTATDSVCLDEIEYAQRACKIPIVPIQVVSCEAPLLIFRLHQINFRYWCESEGTYQAGLNQICAAIAEAIQSRKSPERPWAPSLEPWDFAPFLLEKRKHFTGRQWLFRDMDEWRRKETPPALLITGEPGIGKSAIVAALVQENREGQVLAYHCCRADTPATLEPARFVRSLAGMLAARLEGYGAMLEDAGIKDALERADSDPASAFEAAILSPLHSIPKTIGDRRYLLIDALDEALTHPKRPTIIEVLAARIGRLPPWLGIVATTRSEPGVQSQLRGLPAQALKADDPKNQNDVLAFLRRRLSESGLRNKVEASGKTLDDIALSVLRSSAGNFLFVTTAIDAIEAGQLRLDDIERQPPGHLSSLYEVFFNRLFRDAGIDFQPASQVLEVVAAAREPLSRKQIAAVTGLDAEKELPLLLGRLAAFVPVREGRYSLFHRSLFEWLTGWDAQDQSFAGLYHLSLQEGHKRLADWGWAEYARSVENTSLYCLRHLIAHLHEADRNDQARTVLLDFDWLQAKLEASDVNALIADYDYLPEDKDLRLVQAAIRLSAHVLARDARQLGGQLTGRLLGNTSPKIQALLKQAGERKVFAGFRPLTPSLTAPGGPLIRTFEGHTSSVRAVTVTPDGRRAVSGSTDRTLRLWDLESGQTIHTLKGHTNFVMAVALTPDGRRAVSGSDDQTLRFWDLESGQTLRTLKGHTGSVWAVAVTPDGRRAVSGSDDQTLRFWDLESGQTLRTLKGHTGSVDAVAVTLDGRRAVSGSDDQTLRLWDLESGQTLCTLKGHTGPVDAVAVTPDGRRAVSGCSVERTLRLWDLGTGQTIRPLRGHTGSVWAVALTCDGCRAVSGGEDRTLRLWDLESGQTTRSLEDHTDAIRAVAVTPDGRRALSGSWDKTLRVWDLGTGQRLRTLEGHTDAVRTVAVTPDGCRAVSGSSDNTLRLWDLGTGQTIRTFEGHTKPVRAVAVTPDGRRVVSGSFDGTLRLWDLESGLPIRTLKGHTHSVAAVAVMADGRRVVSASEDGTLRLWDLGSGQTLRTFEGLQGSTGAVAVTSDGRRAVSGSFDRTLRLWDLDSGQTIRTLEGHTDAVWAVAVTPDGRRAVSGSFDRTLRLWDLESGKEIATFTGGSAIMSCAVAPDGETIVAGDTLGNTHFLQIVEADPTKL